MEIMVGNWHVYESEAECRAEVTLARPSRVASPSLGPQSTCAYILYTVWTVNSPLRDPPSRVN